MTKLDPEDAGKSVWAVSAPIKVHCDTNTAEAFFGGGTKLTVLGRKSFYWSFNIAEGCFC